MAANESNLSDAFAKLTQLHATQLLISQLNTNKSACDKVIELPNQLATYVKIYLGDELSMLELKLLVNDKEVLNQLRQVKLDGPEFEFSSSQISRLLLCANYSLTLPLLITNGFLQLIGYVDCNDKPVSNKQLLSLITTITSTDHYLDVTADYTFSFLESIENTYREYVSLEVILKNYQRLALTGHKESLQKVKTGLQNSQGNYIDLDYHNRLIFFRIDNDISGLARFAMICEYAGFHLALLKNDSTNVASFIIRYPSVLTRYVYDKSLEKIQLADMQLIVYALEKINDEDLNTVICTNIHDFIKRSFIFLHRTFLTGEEISLSFCQLMAKVNFLYISNVANSSEDRFELINSYCLIWAKERHCEKVNALIETMIMKTFELSIYPSEKVDELYRYIHNNNKEVIEALTTIMLKHTYLQCCKKQDEAAVKQLRCSHFSKAEEQQQVKRQQSQFVLIYNQYTLMQASCSVKPSYSLKAINTQLQLIENNLQLTIPALKTAPFYQSIPSAAAMFKSKAATPAVSTTAKQLACVLL